MPAPLDTVTHKAPAAAPAAAARKLPTSYDMLRRFFSLREFGHTLAIVGVGSLIASPHALRIGHTDAVAPRALAAIPGVKRILTAVADLALSGNRGWGSIVERVGFRTLMTFGLVGFTGAIMWTQSGAFAVLDWSLRHPESRLGKWAKQRKIQDTQMVSLADYIKAAKVVLRNQLLINLPLAPLYFGMVYNWAIRRHIARSGLALEPGVSALDSVAGAAWASRVPTAGGLVRDLVTCAIMEEAFFYVIHRALHWGPLYRHVHKFHHQFVAPMALSTTYAHPVEYVLSNLTGIVTAPATLGIHPYSIFVWVTFSLSSVIHAHSGYEIYGWPSARLHDWHHYSFNNAFGTYGLLDTWFGTMGGDRWFKYVDAYDRRQEEAEAEAAIENGN